MHFNIRSWSLVTRRLLSLLLCISSGVLFNCTAETDNFFEEDQLTQNTAIGQIEAYEALQIDYYIETRLLKSTNDSISYGCMVSANDVSAKTITIDFSSPTAVTGCTQNAFALDSRIRTGIMYVKYDTKVGDTLGTRTITFDNYTVNQKKIEGQIDLYGIERDTATNLLSGICEFTSFKVSFPDGTYSVFNGKQRRVWLGGENNINAFDNVYSVSTLQDSVGQSGPIPHSFRTVIATPLLLSFACSKLPAISGVISLQTLSGYPDNTRTVNFGTTCDATFTVTTPRRAFLVTYQ